MGLFDGISSWKKEEAKTAASNQLKSHKAINMFVNWFEDPRMSEEPEKNDWVHGVTGYYDARWRTILVTADTLSIHNCQFREMLDEKTDKKTNYDETGIVFTDLGYTPMPSYQDQSGKVLLDRDEVAEIFIKIVRDKIIALFPDYSYSNITVVKNPQSDRFEAAYFQYRLPSLVWTEWFK